MLNKAQLIGRLGGDPDIRYTSNGDAVANISLATSETWKDDNGEKQERTEWHRIVFFGRTAEVAANYLKKGSLIYVEGKIQTRKWQDKEGNDRYTTEIVGQRMQMLGSKGDAGAARAEAQAADQRRSGASKPAESHEPPVDEQGDFVDDDIPF